MAGDPQSPPSYQKQTSAEVAEHDVTVRSPSSSSDSDSEGISKDSKIPQWQRSSSSSMKRRKSSSSGSFRRQRRKSSLIEVIQRAFSIDYESIEDLDDEEYEDEYNGSLSRSNSPRILCCSVVLLLMLALALAAFYELDSWNAFQADATAASTEQTCPSVDPIMALKGSATKEHLKNGAVASDHPLCSQMGLDILRHRGGNAVDAAVTVALCLGVANPASSGLGGGAFLLVHADPFKGDESTLPPFHDARTAEGNFHQSKTGKVSEVIDCREIAPGAAFQDMYLDQPDIASTVGGLAIPVPGELKGLELAHARHGRLAWSAVVDPVVKLLQRGVPVNPNLAYEIHNFANLCLDDETKDACANTDVSAIRNVLTKKDNWDHPLREGDRLHNPRLAETLAAVRDGGSDALYKGDRAAQLAQDVQTAGGIITQEDMELYQATLRSPVVGHGISGLTLVGVPPPSSGGAVIIGIARFLSGFSNPFAMFPETLSVHQMVEASKHAFAIRMSLSDPAFNSKVVAEVVHDLVGPSYMEMLRKTLHRDNATLPLSKYGGEKWAQLKDTDGQGEAKDAKEGDRRRRLGDAQLKQQRHLVNRFGYLNDHGTSHFNILDREGNAVSATSSVNTYFGSTVVSPSTGIFLGNTMDDFGNPGRPNFFGLKPSPSNFIVAGKKPLSSMSPTMVFRHEEGEGGDKVVGELMLILGASGGPKIISALTSVITKHLLRGMPLFEAIVHPRVHDQLIYHEAAVTTVENSVLEQGPSILVGNRTRSALVQRGHALLDVDYEGTVQAISVDLHTKEITAACDLRKGGAPAGY